MNKKSFLILVSGPSGVGKNTLREIILKESDLNLKFSVSYTTRKPRVGECDGIDYYFVSKDSFLEDVKKGNFLEYAEFIGNYYGTNKKSVDYWFNEGKNVFLEIETQGAKQVLDKFNKDEIISFFIMPPTFDDLKKRILKRSTETLDVIEKRLEKAKKEMTCTSYFQHIIVNDNVERAANEIIRLIKERINKN